MNTENTKQPQPTQSATVKQPVVHSAQPEPVKEFASKVENLMYHADATEGSQVYP